MSHRYHYPFAPAPREVDAIVAWCAENGLDAEEISREDFYVTRSMFGKCVAHFRTFKKFSEDGVTFRRHEPDGGQLIKNDWEQRDVSSLPPAAWKVVSK